MNISFTFTGVESNDSLRDYATKRVSDCEKLLGDASGAALCDVEFAQSKPGNSGPIFYAEVNIDANGTLFRATAEEESFEAAIDKVKDELLRELKRAKDKRIESQRKGGAQAKDMLRGEQ